MSSRTTSKLPIRRAMLALAVLAAAIGTVAVTPPAPAAAQAPGEQVRLPEVAEPTDLGAGVSMSRHGTTLVVGSPGGAGRGSVQVYDDSGPTPVQVTSLVAPDGADGDGFGRSVAIDGDTLAVGAPGHDQPAGDAGAVYVFVRAGGVWSFDQKLSQSGASTGNLFGRSVALRGDHLAVGAPFETFPGAPSGSAHLFQRSGGGFGHLTSFTSPSPFLAGLSDRFGWSVALTSATSGTYLTIGAPWEDHNAINGIDSGAVYRYLFNAGTWQYQDRLVGTSVGSDQFGYSLAMDGDRLAVGALGAWDGPQAVGSTQTGAVWAYTVATGPWVGTRLDPTPPPGGWPAPGPHVGTSVAVLGDTLAVGAVGAPVDGVPNIGAVYAYRNVGGTWNLDAELTSSAVEQNGFLGTSVVLGPSKVRSGAVSSIALPSLVVGFSRVAGVWSEDVLIQPGQDRGAGQAVALAETADGVFAFVGASRAWTGAGPNGVVFVYRLQAAFDGGPLEWVQVDRLEPAVPSGDDRFGRALSVDGNRLAIGAPGGGRVELWQWSGTAWQFVDSVSVPGVQSADRFGAAVALDANRLAVGAPGDDADAVDAGAVFVFTRAGGVWGAGVRGDRVAAAYAGDELGAAVAITGQQVFAGAPGAPYLGPEAGMVFRFTPDGAGWRVNDLFGGDLILGPDTGAGDRLGASLDATDALLVGGAPNADRNGLANRGEVVVWSTTGTDATTGAPVQAVLAGDNSAAGDDFGSSVAVQATTVAVGARFADPAGTNSGAAYAFGRIGDTWVQRAAFVADDGSDTDRLGVGVAVSPDATRIAAGAPGVSGLYPGGGAGYVFGYAPTAPDLPMLRVASAGDALPTVISVDGIRRHQWGLTWLDLDPGSYEVCFSDVPGYVTGACETAVLMGTDTTVVTYPGVQQALLQVTTSPALPATITVDGHPANDWGAFTFVEPNTALEVCFGPVAGFAAPACEAVPAGELAPGEFVQVTGTYTADAGAPGPGTHGNLRVTTSPAVPATIFIDGQPANGWGLDWVKMEPGSYEICFSDVPGFITPDCDTVTVVAGETAELTGTFVEAATIRATSAPASNTTVFVNGVPANNWGLFLDVAPGFYQVCMGPSRSTGLWPTVPTGGCTELNLSPGLFWSTTFVFP